MFVDPDAVEAHLIGELELVHVLVVETVRPLGIEELAVDIDPHRPVRLPKVIGQIRPWHEIEPDELHDVSPSGLLNRRIFDVTSLSLFSP